MGVVVNFALPLLVPSCFISVSNINQFFQLECSFEASFHSEYLAAWNGNPVLSSGSLHVANQLVCSFEAGVSIPDILQLGMEILFLPSRSLHVAIRSIPDNELQQVNVATYMMLDKGVTKVSAAFLNMNSGPKLLNSYN